MFQQSLRKDFLNISISLLTRQLNYLIIVAFSSVLKYSVLSFVSNSVKKKTCEQFERDSVS